MSKFRRPLVSTLLTLVSIGLFASLLPHTSFVSRSSSEVVDAIGPVWPDQSVEQVLDDVDIVSEVRIWAAAGHDRGEAPVVGSLLRGEAEEPVRQVKVPIRASKLLEPYVVVFPPYRPAPGEKLRLQLWVSTERGPERELDYHVMFGANKPGTGAPASFNRHTTDYGPLAHEFIWKGTGWQAALEGSTPDLARLTGALAAAGLTIAMTVLSHPLVSRPLRNTRRRMRIGFRYLASRVRAALRLSWDHGGVQAQPAQTSAGWRAFYVFPWLIPAFAILHYLSNNLLLFRPSESIALLVVSMAAVTAVFVALRLALKNAAVAAVATGLLGIAFFSYGHVYIALGDHADDRYLLGLGIPIVLGLLMFVRRRPEPAHKIGTILNFACLALVAVSTYRIAISLLSASSLEIREPSEGFAGLDERVAEAKVQFSGDELRDIYYIILDEYPRSGSPPEFDNSEFVQELESRGFYVAGQARSNYDRSSFSIPSSLNMEYIQDFNEHDQYTSPLLREMADDHNLGRIVKALGYKYLHVSSGYRYTTASRNADLVVDFKPSGRVLSGPDTTSPLLFETVTRLSSRFTTTFLRTTLAKPFLSHEFSADRNGGSYDWSHPFWTLEMFDFLRAVGTRERPKFVFAHILKPHPPYSFDKSGNIAFDRSGWRDDHDPSVPSAFYGQLKYVNGRMLEVIDDILDDYQEPPIIVIVGDHGHLTTLRFDILAAFLLPDGGESAVYPSITSVNHFRAILDYYFGLKLGLLEDRVYR